GAARHERVALSDEGLRGASRTASDASPAAVPTAGDDGLLIMLPEIFRRRPQMLPPQEAYAIWAESYPPRPHNPLMEMEQATVAPVLASCAASAPRRAL